MKFEIFKFKNVTSTNDVAMRLIKNEQTKHGIVYANMQTKGRGTKGKKWISHKGNLFNTIFFPLKKKYPPFNEFSIINPIIISDVIKHFCKSKQINLKFPNDIFLNGKKVCGILQELIYLNEKKYLIVGIGINIVSSPKINQKYQSTNIYMETKKKITSEEVFKLIVFSYEKFFISLKKYNYLNFKKKAERMAIN